ncbi:DNA-methyltransferase [Staphylococcus epidermidis]|uniref:DNA-methyltransferase n=1 Tax=Staphylococcus epidermidis TaxID=1282 RepID=UPI0039769833
MLDEKQQYLKHELVKIKNCDIEVGLLNTIVLDMSRIADKEITNIINKYKKAKNIIVSSPEKELLRKAILGYDVDVINYSGFLDFAKLFNKENYLLQAYNLIIEGVKKNKEGVIGSLYSRTKIDGDIENKYADYISDIEKDYTQLLYYNLHNNNDINKVYTSINQLYDSLENYHYCLLEFQSSCTWENIYKIAIYLENFKLETGLNAFKKNKQIETMKKFVDNNLSIINPKDVIEKINNFYSGVNYGFQFQDLLITENGERKLLVFQKVELDEQYVPCPSCFEKILRGNSYPKMLYRSFECQNPNCPSRSKSGRGKRFDYYSVKRNNKLLLNDPLNYINNNLRTKFRRDIVNNDSNFLEFGIKFYTWASNLITVLDSKQIPSVLFGRKINLLSLEEYDEDKDRFNNLSIYKLLNSINSAQKNEKKYQINRIKNIDKSTLINGDSTLLLNNDYNNLYNLSITSPPYFNAREYSQWSNLILYLIDMMLNAKSVYNSMQVEGIYAYNIGDIVDKDNIYVNSQMSIKRQMLGFYSMMIFEIAGFNIVGDDIWDKGEVQSKRNSSNNSFPGFLKPINCYEHIIYFQKIKHPTFNLSSEVTKIDTVKKINSKGVNKYGHTAPYPEKLVEFVLKKLTPYINNDINILDPFLGSGTTCIVSNRLNYTSTGIELNETYFDLCCKRLLINY